MTEVPSRLRWACRRGMLELDILLGKYLEQGYLQSSASDKQLFEKLLECNDQELFDWFSGNSIANDPELLRMVEKIREFKRLHR